jgi:ubiquinone/menaquinone biosynthesis C-methylase UbiE
VTVAQADLTDLPFEDGRFDVVASYLMLLHVIQWRQALAEAFRVLNPGWTFVVTTST